MHFGWISTIWQVRHKQVISALLHCTIKSYFDIWSCFILLAPRHLKLLILWVMVLYCSYWSLLDLYDLSSSQCIHSVTLTCTCPFYHCISVFEVQPLSLHAEGSEMVGSWKTHTGSCILDLNQQNHLICVKCVHAYSENTVRVYYYNAWIKARALTLWTL